MIPARFKAEERKACASGTLSFLAETHETVQHIHSVETEWPRVSTRLTSALVSPFWRPGQSKTGAGPLRDTQFRVLLRKEVIQPHLPVRLPCYDFTPIANPTFERSLPKGLSHVLRVLSTFVV